MKAPTVAATAAALYLAHIFCGAWTSSSQIFLGLSIIAAGLAWYRGELRPPYDSLYIPLSIFLVGSILSSLFSPGGLSTLGEVSEAFTFLSVPLALSLYRRDRSLVDKALIAFALLGILIALWGQFEWLVLGWRDLEHRISGPAAHVMSLSGILIIVSLLMAAASIRYRSPLFIFAFALTMLTLVLTQTRGAWLGWIAGFATFLLVKKPKLAPWLLVAGLVALILSPTSIFYRISSVASLQPASNYDRVKMIEGGVAMIRDHPVFGTGPGTTKDNYVLYRSPDAFRFRTPHLHNNVIQLWAERGILTLTGYLVLIALLVIRFYRLSRSGGRERKWMADAGLAIVVAMSIAGLFEYNFGDSEVMVAFLNVSVLCLIGANSGSEEAKKSRNLSEMRASKGRDIAGDG